MDNFMQELVRGFCFTGDVASDAPRFLRHHHCEHAAAHSANVALQAGRLARRFDVCIAAAELAGWLHDISAVVPLSERLAVAHILGLDVLPEEAALPMILHQKLSVAFAQELFAVDDAAILSAIGCHTTLKPEATVLDKVVFLADKIAWDQPGAPPYLQALSLALEYTLDAAVCVYLEVLWSQRATLPVVHPWFVAAYAQLCKS